MQLYIKNMVCDRCKMVVKAELQKLGFNPISVKLGEVKLNQESINIQEKEAIKQALNKYGFELLMNKKRTNFRANKNGNHYIGSLPNSTLKG